MAELTVNLVEDKLPTGEAVVSGHVVGSINTSNIQELEKRINAHTARGIRMICLDLSRLDYINSTGLGLLVKISDSLADSGGRVHLYNLPSKIESLLSMLGLTDIIHIYPSRNSAIKAFRTVGSESDDGPFPIQHSCTSCNLYLEFEEEGKFRCPACNDYFDVKGDGSVVSFSSTRLRFIETKIPLDAKFIPGLQAMASTLIASVGISKDDGESIEHILDEFCSYLILKHTSKNASLPVMHLMLIADRTEIRLAFRGKKKLIQDPDTELNTELPLKLIGNLADEINIIPLQGDAQMVVMVKAVKQENDNVTPDKSEDVLQD